MREEISRWSAEGREAKKEKLWKRRVWAGTGNCQQTQGWDELRVNDPNGEKEIRTGVFVIDAEWKQ